MNGRENTVVKCVRGMGRYHGKSRLTTDFSFGENKSGESCLRISKYRSCLASLQEGKLES